MKENHIQAMTAAVSSTDYLHSMDRKSKKPMMEKRRRARINKYLTDLKSLIMQRLKRDSGQNSKLEKADILEMTVQMLRLDQKEQLALAAAGNPAVLTKFHNGWQDCRNVVANYLRSNANGFDTEVSKRLLTHLDMGSQTIHKQQRTLEMEMTKGQPLPRPVLQFPSPLMPWKILATQLPVSSTASKPLLLVDQALAGLDSEKRSPTDSEVSEENCTNTAPNGSEAKNVWRPW